MIRSIGALFRHEDLIKGQVSLGDDSETDIFDVGALSSSTVQRIESAYVDLTTNGHNNVDFKLYVDVNGSLVQVGSTKNVSADGAQDLGQLFDIATPIASSRIRMTATGDQAAPGTAATIDHTVEHSTAT